MSGYTASYKEKVFLVGQDIPRPHQAVWDIQEIPRSGEVFTPRFAALPTSAVS